MVYRVEISPSALADAEATFLWIQKDSPQKAEEWYNGLVDAILSLESFPNRCPIAAESQDIEREIRQLLHKKHRIIINRSFSLIFPTNNDNVCNCNQALYSSNYHPPNN